MGFFDTLAGVFRGDATSDTFLHRVRAIARQLGLEVIPDDDGAPVCALPIDINGDNYTFILAQTGASVRLSACSNVKFPPGRLPRAVISHLAQQNKELDFCDYDVINSRKHSYFCIQSTVQWNRLTAAIIQTAIRELVGRIAALDTVMVREGYAH
jgi:hypothetical protein